MELVGVEFVINGAYPVYFHWVHPMYVYSCACLMLSLPMLSAKFLQAAWALWCFACITRFLQLGPYRIGLIWSKTPDFEAATNSKKKKKKNK